MFAHIHSIKNNVEQLRILNAWGNLKLSWQTYD